MARGEPGRVLGSDPDVAAAEGSAALGGQRGSVRTAVRSARRLLGAELTPSGCLLSIAYSQSICLVSFAVDISWVLWSCRIRVEPILNHEASVVPSVQQLDVHLGVQLSQATQLPVLLCHQALFQRGQLDVQVELRKIEVGREALDYPSFGVVLQRECPGLVFPLNLVKVQEVGELSFALVGERM